MSHADEYVQQLTAERDSLREALRDRIAIAAMPALIAELGFVDPEGSAHRLLGVSGRKPGAPIPTDSEHVIPYGRRSTCSEGGEMSERDKYLTEAMGECWHKTSFKEYELEIEGCIGIFVEKKCSCGEIQRIGKSMASSSNPLHNNKNTNFSTWEGFGKLFEFCQKQEWWETFIANRLLKFSGCHMIEMYIHPDRFADAIYAYLKEGK